MALKNLFRRDQRPNNHEQIKKDAKAAFVALLSNPPSPEDSEPTMGQVLAAKAIHNTIGKHYNQIPVEEWEALRQEAMAEVLHGRGDAPASPHP